MFVAGYYDFSNWKEAFKDYLTAKGYKPSVVKDYSGRIERLLKDEGITIQQLFKDIDKWIDEFKTGSLADINRKRHYAPSSALVAFKEFAPALYHPNLPNSNGIDIYEKDDDDLLYFK